MSGRWTLLVRAATRELARDGLMALVVAAAALVHAPVSAQADRIVVGAVTEDVVSAHDPSQRYAVYVPSSYEPGRAWPLVLVMDPRGRASLPLERLADAAERLGYVLVSSYGTASDGPWEPNEPAVDAMLTDAQRLFSIDGRRLYFVGFSGTARVAWSFGARLAEYTAGVIGFGAGLPTPGYLAVLSAQGDPPFAFFGGAGRLDFNYEEVVRLDRALDGYGFAHHVEIFPGAHEWPPADILEGALEWMELHAVRSGLAERDAAWVQGLYDERMGSARATDEAGAVHAAALRYRSIVEDFDGLADVQAARSRAGELTSTDAFREAEARLQDIFDESDAYDRRLYELLSEVEKRGRAPSAGSAMRTLDVAELRERAAATDDAEKASAAGRLLERAYVRLSFYEPRAYMESGRYALAAAMYQWADALRPDSPRVCLGLAQAYAQMGERDRALDALECLVRSGALPAEQLEADTLLAPLRGDERFVELLRRRR
jgi:predicted esterase